MEDVKEETLLEIILEKYRGSSPGLLENFAKPFLEKIPTGYRRLLGWNELANFILTRFYIFLEVTGTKSSVEIHTGKEEDILFARRTLIDVAVSNGPFVVETTHSYFSYHRLSVLLSIRFTLIVPADGGTEEMSYSFYAVEPVNKSFIKESEISLRRSLDGVKVVTGDFEKILASADKTASLLADNNDATEAINFIRWIQHNNFIYLGTARVRATLDDKAAEVTDESGTGLLRSEFGLQKKLLSCPLSKKQISFSVTDEVSFVHKFENIVLARIRLPGPGEEFILIGNFTSAAKRLEFSTIPVVREKIKALLDERGWVTNSYDYKNECILLHKIPLEELFSISLDAVKQITAFLNEITGAVAFHAHHDTLSKLFVAVITLHENIFTQKLFSRIKKVFRDEFRGPFRSYQNNMEGERTILHFYCGLEEGFEVDTKMVENRIRDICKSWETHIREEVIKISGDSKTGSALDDYLTNLPQEYRSSVSAEFAAMDFIYSRFFTDEKPKVEVFIKKPGDESLILRFFSNYDITLSETMQVLGSFGFEVIHSDHFALVPAGMAFRLRIITFEVLFHQKLKEFEYFSQSLSHALIAALNHTTHLDPLNQLSIKRGIPHTKLKLIRAYRNLLIQYSGSLKISSINAALIRYEAITERVLDFFEEKFSPLRQPESKEESLPALEKTKDHLNTMLLEVGGIQDDRILRSIIKLVDASLRTNFYIDGSRESEAAISVKIDPKRLDFVADSKPFREIFVYDIDMEGIHLRGGKIARGGIRWSDRTDDYRTEVLGLLKTQMVKNTIIVPVGSKGGFVVKRTKANINKEIAGLGVTAYRKFISGLLDITDNYSPDNRELHPPKCVIYDDFDPYLVVAADKGTASFSDIANEISAHYGFWLKDAFASGGSNGYSHKEMGITARGAWECAKRHFREMGKDIQTSSITVTGIGDMSGDVFGNAMLLSKEIKLVAAFNHLYIFIDPSPGDTRLSHSERKRLFEMENSNWNDYSKDLISGGGGVFPRNSKTIPLTTEIRDLLRTAKEEVNGEELIRLVLEAPVDMIFHGGIGTYIKASTETHSEVNDKGNDNVRVNASDVRAKTVVEGGNLGITQKGRIEYEKCGGVINSDAIDNSAGVDTSDHEVNLKILIESLKSSGKITTDEEGWAILSGFREFAVQRVLGHNQQQSAIISMDRINFLKDPTNFFDTLKTLESDSLLNRKEDDIPGNGEIEQMRQSTGFPRSVLSYIMGLEKIRIYNIVSHSEITRVEIFRKFLFEYFPPAFHEKYRTEIVNHRLGKDIIANFLTNRIINRGGLALVHSLSYHSPASVEQVIETYFFVYEILDAQKFRFHAMKLENTIKTEVLYHMLIRYERVIYKMVKWILQQPQEKFVDFEKITIYKEKIQNYFKEYFLFLSDISPKSYKHLFDEIEGLKADNVPEELAKEAAYSIFLKPALGLIRISEQTGLSIRMVAESNIIIGERFHLHYLHSCLRNLPLKTEWDKACHNALKSELYSKLDRLVSKILLIPTNGRETGTEEESPLSRIYKFLGIKTGYTKTESSDKCEEMRRSIIEKLEIFIKENESQIAELDKLVHKLKESSHTSLTPVVVIEKFIANLVQ